MPAQPSTTLGGWNSSLDNQVQPSSGKKALGWVVNEKPASSYFNWLFFVIDSWITWLSTLLSTTNTWTDGQHFTGGSGQAVAVIATAQSGSPAIVANGTGSATAISATGTATAGAIAGTTSSGLPAVSGQNTSTGYGTSGTAVGGVGVAGSDSAGGIGVWGLSSSGPGVKGSSTSGPGIQAVANASRGALVITPSTAPSTTSAGDFYVDSTSHLVKEYTPDNGGTWATLAQVLGSSGLVTGITSSASVTVLTCTGPAGFYRVDIWAKGTAAEGSGLAPATIIGYGIGANQTITGDLINTGTDGTYTIWSLSIPVYMPSATTNIIVGMQANSSGPTTVEAFATVTRMA